MVSVRCPRCGAVLKSLAELEKLARTLSRGARRPDTIAQRQTNAQQLVKGLCCHAKHCTPPRRHQQHWKIYRGIRK